MARVNGRTNDTKRHLLGAVAAGVTVAATLTYGPFQPPAAVATNDGRHGSSSAPNPCWNDEAGSALTLRVGSGATQGTSPIWPLTLSWRPNGSPTTAYACIWNDANANRRIDKGEPAQRVPLDATFDTTRTGEVVSIDVPLAIPNASTTTCVSVGLFRFGSTGSPTSRPGHGAHQEDDDHVTKPLAAAYHPDGDDGPGSSNGKDDSHSKDDSHGRERLATSNTVCPATMPPAVVSETSTPILLSASAGVVLIAGIALARRRATRRAPSAETN